MTQSRFGSPPYGLVGPYRPVHAGDNMCVGYFTKVSEKSTEFLRYVVRHSLCAEDMRPGNPPPGAYVP